MELERCLLRSCAGCKLVRCGNCARCLGRTGGCHTKVFAGDCQNPNQPRTEARAPRRAPVARSAAPPKRRRQKWSEEENARATELYAQGGRDKTAFGNALSTALKGSKSVEQCKHKFDVLREKEPTPFYVFDWDEGNPTKHSAELIAALPKADRNLGEPEIKRRWWAEVNSRQDKGRHGAREFVSYAVDRVFNYFGNGESPSNTKDHVHFLVKSGLPPSFLDLDPPKRNTPAFRKAFDKFHRETLGVRHTRKAALAQLAGTPLKCKWGYLLPGQERSTEAVQMEMARRAVLYTCLGEGANPATEMPKDSERTLIKASTIMPPFEPVASGATHATDPSYARREPA